MRSNLSSREPILFHGVTLLILCWSVCLSINWVYLSYLGQCVLQDRDNANATMLPSCWWTRMVRGVELSIMKSLVVGCSFIHAASLGLDFASTSLIDVRDPSMAKVFDSPSFRAFQGGESRVCVLALGKPTVSIDHEVGGRLDPVLQDAMILRNLGFGASAGVVSGKHSQIRNNVHQTWLRSVGSTVATNAIVGNTDDRARLIRFMETLRSSLESPIRTLPSVLMELAYLDYEPGAFYARHVDTISKNLDSRNHKRSVSLVLYLGDPDDPREWDADMDGGSLRIFHQDDTFVDVPPHPWTLLLFDSDAVPHEVLETHRRRVCVVGWFGSPCSGTNER